MSDRKVPYRELTTTATAVKTSLGKRVRAVSNFITLFPFHTICLMLGNFSGVNSKGLYLSSEKENENCCLAVTSSIKRETEEVSRCSRATTANNCTKSVMHVQNCYFANLNLLLFCRSRFRRRPRCLSSLLWDVNEPLGTQQMSGSGQPWVSIANSYLHYGRS